MPALQLPYGKTHLAARIPAAGWKGTLLPRLSGWDPGQGEEELVESALAAPTGSLPLRELAAGKRRVVILISDHTRPVPSRRILPPMLREIRAASPDAQVTLLVATGCHRGPTREELEDKLGEALLGERIAVHDCDDKDNLVELGRLPSGALLRINRLAAEADLLLAEGFIEPHFFAGYSGGRKSVLPGIADRASVLGNHCADFIAHPRARAGVLEGNPIHEDMIWAARRAGLAFVVNVVVNPAHQVVCAVAGDVDQAHRRGCALLEKLCGIPGGETADVVITSNGGYPLDQNIYQAVKGMTTAEALVRPGGVIIMAARSEDGHGGEAFYRTFREERDPARLMARFLETPREATEPDQWQSQIFARVLLHARVIYLSDAPDQLVRELHMHPAHSVEEALELAGRLLDQPAPAILAAPQGVASIVRM